MKKAKSGAAVAGDETTRYGTLLLTLTLLLMGFPYLPATVEEKSWILEGGLALILAACIYAVGSTRKFFWIGLLLAAPPISLRLIFNLSHAEHFDKAAILLFGAFSVFVVIGLLKKISSHEVVTGDTIAAAICAYLLLAVAWSCFYVFVELAYPHSFYFDPSRDFNGKLGWNDLAYYSFATLTTCGYGDITAVSSQARSLTCIEAVVGVFYPATLVARLVSMHMEHRQRRPEHLEESEG